MHSRGPRRCSLERPLQFLREDKLKRKGRDERVFGSPSYERIEDNVFGKREAGEEFHFLKVMGINVVVNN